MSISNPGCLFHIRAGLRARGSNIRALHLAELLDVRGATANQIAGWKVRDAASALLLDHDLEIRSAG